MGEYQEMPQSQLHATVENLRPELLIDVTLAVYH
jgi:hypothetical protein